MSQKETYSGHIMPMHDEITSDDINKFFEGSDPMKRIIAIELGYDDAEAEIVYVDDNGCKRIKKEGFKPFVWAKNSACVRMFSGNRGTLRKKMREYGIGVRPLYTCREDNPYPHEKLDNGYKYLWYAKSNLSMGRFQNFFKEAGTPLNGKKRADDDASSQEFMMLQPVEQFMIETGKRLFKGYDNYDDLLRMSFDLETEGLNPKIHHISQIGIRTNKGYEKIITITGNTKEEKEKNEFNAIVEFIKIIAEIKPDVIFGHNSENFDFDFFIVRCKMMGVDFKLLSEKYLREGIYKKSKPTTLKLGGEVETYYQTVIKYHNVVDSLHAVRRAMATDSSFEKANLKYATKYLKLNKENRVYVPGNIIETTWRITEPLFAFNNTNGDWYKVTEEKPLQEGYEMVSGKYIVERYLLDDLWECDKVELSLHETDFHLTKIMPTTFPRVATMGTATQWKLILLTWAYEHNMAVPSLGKNKRYTGGLSRLLKTGFVTSLCKGDYAALYPTTQITWNIEPATDFMHITLPMLMYVLVQREYHKGLKKDSEKKAENLYNQLKNLDGRSREYKEISKERDTILADKINHDNQQLVLKKLANSWFGSLGCPGLNPWGDLTAAEKTTCIGRMLLRIMIYFLKEKRGYTPIVGDSVTYDTPVFINRNGEIDIVPICEVFDDNAGKCFDDEQYRDFSEKPFKILTRNGWQNIVYVYKHKTKKQLKRVETKNGLVDCTIDHSLFDKDGNEVKPSSIKRGDSIEIYTNNIEYLSNRNISEKQAWLYGFFMADGSSVYCDRKQKYFSKKKGEFVTHVGKRANWKISNKSLERLEKAKHILENEFNVKCSIKDHISSSNVYDLVVENSEFSKMFSNMFYTSYRYKKVPSIILNSKKEIKKSFLNGFCCGDGQNDTIDECIEFGQKSKVAMAGLYFMLKELNYNFRCHNRKDKHEFISFRFRNHRGNLLNENYSNRCEDKVWNNSEITSKSEYVYDISADGTFVNALGMIVCHNTDGFDFKLPEKFKYTKDNPYIGKGLNRYVKKGKEYTDAEADFAEFNDLYLNKTYNGSNSNMSANEIDEYVESSINFSRKNYCCRMQRDGSIKRVGNTIKSRKMSGFLQKFLDKALDMLIDGEGETFLNAYYDYIDDIYNYRISVRDIASKGNIKKSLEEYKADCNTLTKSGSKKSRQAWYELAIQNDLNVNPGDTIYYVNTGSKKSETDAKRITHQFIKNPDNPNEEVELTSKLKSKILKDECQKRGLEYKTLKTKDKKDLLAPYIVREEDEVILNCKVVPFEVIENEKDLLCSDVPDLEYNVEKYIEQFNKRITPLLVCFHPNIRSEILIKNPKDRKYWTKEDAELVSGYPMKPEDQDTYEALMTPERKEIEFWEKIGERPPFVDECGIPWDKLVEEYHETVNREADELFQAENAKYLEALDNLTQDDVNAFEEDGELPKSITDLVTLSPKDMRFYFIRIPDMTPTTGGYIFSDIKIGMQEHGIETEAFIPEMED